MGSVEVDYAKSGLDIQYAMLDSHKRHGRLLAGIRWGTHTIQTADCFQVPKSGVVRAEVLSCRNVARQGFDIKVDGALVVAGQSVRLLRTWYDSRLPAVVEYAFVSNDRRMCVWNVYTMAYAGGQTVEEKWTGNAGFWVEEVSPTDRVYHCSSGGLPAPDFDTLSFRVTVAQA